MCHLILQHISLVLTVILNLLLGGSDGVNNTSLHTNISGPCHIQNAMWIISTQDAYTVTGLAVAGVLILLSLVCNYITCIVIMCKKAKHTVPVSYQEDKEGTRVKTGEDELLYTTVTFTQDANDSVQVTKFDPKSEYATVVINTPDPGTPQLDCVDNVEE